MANTTWSNTDKSAQIVLGGTNNLTVTVSGASPNGVRTIDRQITGKYYFEITTTTVAGTGQAVGVANAGAALAGGMTAAGSVSAAFAVSSGSVYINGVVTGVTIGSFTSGSIVCVAVDLTDQLIWFRVGAAGNWNGNASYNPATGVGGLATPILGQVDAAYPYWQEGGASTNAAVANFGDTAFSGTVPSGFTSGFPTGTPTLIAAATQVALEQWAQGTPQAQLTQVGMEMWGSVPAVTVQALMTQIAMEQWASTASAAAAQARAMILA